MTQLTDTIAAIATAPGEAAISIVRVSGPRSLAIADSVFQCSGPPPSERPSHTFVYGHVRSGDASSQSGHYLDEAILLIYRNPRSYTREDVVEFQGHGGYTSARRILRRLLDAGARPAAPGEFTRRAFLSGRIDLVQAEAVLDLIRARSDRAATMASEQLEGALSARVTSIYNLFVAIAADLEATLDFPDDELPDRALSDILNRIKCGEAELRLLLDTWDEGHVLREGALVVISGRTNVGKSTLFNRMVGRDRAIVAELPGTTRDAIEESLILDDIPLRLVDTAGLRSTGCSVEREGILRAEAYIQRADLDLHVVDASVPLEDEEKRRILALPLRTTLVVLNKADLGVRIDAGDLASHCFVVCSLVDGSGVGDLKKLIVSKLGVKTSVQPRAAIGERHRHAIVSGLRDIADAAGIVEAGQDSMVGCAADSLRSALLSLGTIIGRVYDDELLNQIFSRFCVGK